MLNLETIIAICEIIGNPKYESESRVQIFSPSSEFSAGGLSDKRISPSGSLSAANSQAFSPTVQPSYKPPPSFKARGAILKNEAPARIIPISSLNPYQGRWAIKARVTSKSDLRRYNNARGDGKVFSFDLLDSDGGEIRVTCFNSAVDRFFDQIKAGKIYLISKGTLKPTQKNFNHLDHQWEIFLDSNSTVDLCPDDDASILEQKFNFKTIDQIEISDNNSILDIIGIVSSISPSTTILRKNGIETQRRIISMKDTSGKSVDLTLWGDLCNSDGRIIEEMIDTHQFPVLAVKSGKVNEFSGKTVGTISSTKLFINPNLPETQRLRNWFESGGNSTTFKSISIETMPLNRNIRKTVAEIKNEGLGRGDKPDWVSLKGTISFIKTDNFCYPACRKCSKKVIKIGGERWNCQNCNRQMEDCDYRYILQVQVQDHTGSVWVTCFQESGEHILGIVAKDLFLMKNVEGDDEGFAEVFQTCVFEKYLFWLKIKEEVFGEEQRVRITAVTVEKVNSAVECRYLLDCIGKKF